jgi:plasmid replication initiation protein
MVVITDISKVNNNWIYQSNKLIEASYSFTVLEQKLIRLLASMIKKDDDNFKEYEFKATDLSKILNVHQKNIYMELDKITDKLMARYIKIKNDDSQKFKKRHLIKIADFENGILTMKIDEDMKEFYLSLNWYTKYQLKNIMQFKSTYSFRLYELLKQYEKLGNRLITIDDLRSVLDIDTSQYPKYANLKQKVINVAVTEVNLKTDLHIQYEELKEIRKVTSVKFYIKQNKTSRNEIAVDSVPVIEGQQSIEDIANIEIVKSIIDNINDTGAMAILKVANNDIENIKEKYSIISKMKKVNNLTGAMIQAIKEEWTTNSINNNSFNNFEGRQYDYDSLEKKLLGWE